MIEDAFTEIEVGDICMILLGSRCNYGHHHLPDIPLILLE